MPTIHFENATGNFTYEEVNVPPPNPNPGPGEGWAPPLISAPTPAPK